jgi:hypothetical protein
MKLKFEPEIMDTLGIDHLRVQGGVRVSLPDEPGYFVVGVDADDMLELVPQRSAAHRKLIELLTGAPAEGAPPWAS